MVRREAHGADRQLGERGHGDRHGGGTEGAGARRCEQAAPVGGDGQRDQERHDGDECEHRDGEAGEFRQHEAVAVRGGSDLGDRDRGGVARPHPPRRQRDDRTRDLGGVGEPEGDVATTGVGRQPCQIATTLAEELLVQRLDPAQHEDARRDQGRARCETPPHRGALDRPMRPPCDTECGDEECAEDVGVADVGLDQHAGDEGRPGDAGRPSSGTADHQHEQQQERQQQCVRLPDVDQHLAAHRPREGS